MPSRTSVEMRLAATPSAAKSALMPVGSSARCVITPCWRTRRGATARAGREPRGIDRELQRRHRDEALADAAADRLAALPRHAGGRQLPGARRDEAGLLARNVDAELDAEAEAVGHRGDAVDAEQIGACDRRTRRRIRGSRGAATACRGPPFFQQWNTALPSVNSRGRRIRVSGVISAGFERRPGRPAA